MTRRRMIVSVGMAATAALVTGYLVTTISYRLEPGVSSWHGSEARLRTEGSAGQLIYTFHPGGPMTFGASIRNPGPWPVTIATVAVNSGPPENHIFKIDQVTMVRSDGVTPVYPPETATPFQPVRVAAGAELAVFLTVTMPNVEMAPGSGLSFDDLAVGYEVLGVPRHERVPMGFRVFVQQPAPASG